MLKGQQKESYWNQKGGDILCLTETQQKIDEVVVSNCFVKHDSMRKMQEKKGGGIIVMYKGNSDRYKYSRI